MDADNDLEPFLIDDVDELELIGSTDQVNVLALVVYDSIAPYAKVAVASEELEPCSGYPNQHKLQRYLEPARDT